MVHSKSIMLLSWLLLTNCGSPLSNQIFHVLFSSVMTTECHVCSFEESTYNFLGSTSSDESGDRACRDNPSSVTTTTCEGECYVRKIMNKSV